MFVLFLSFVFLSKSASETIPDSQNKNNTQLKNQLQKSLSHVDEMLADIEGKIENQRKILSQLDYDLNYKEQPGFVDHEVAEIWWQTTPTPSSLISSAGVSLRIDIRSTYQPHNINRDGSAKPGEESPSIPVVVSNWVKTANLERNPMDGEEELQEKSIFNWSRPSIPPTTVTRTTTPLLQTTLTMPIIPKETTISTFRPAPGWPSDTTTDAPVDSIFIQDMKNLMAIDRYGYFTTFLTKFLEMIAVKEVENVTPVVQATATHVGKMIEGQELKSFGDHLLNSMRMLLTLLATFKPETLQQQAGVGHYVMKNKQTLVSKEANAVLDYYDNMFTKEEGENLYKALELFDKYPNGGMSASFVSETILNAMLAPTMRLEGTRDQKKLIRYINQAIQEMYPHWRSQIQRRNFGQPSYDSADQYNSTIPSRRSLNIKKIMRHFFYKHPNLFKKSNRHHKHVKKNKKRHKYTNRNKQYRRPHHRKHEKYGHSYEQLLKKNNDKESNYDQKNEVDTSISGAFYQDANSKRPEKRIIKEVEPLKQPRTQTEPHISKYGFDKTKQKQTILKMLANNPSKYRKNFNTKYLKQIALKILRNQQSNINLRRFMIEPSKRDVTNQSYDSQTSLDNSMLQKIRETSSYSDEEEYLKTNLYDALRHGNRTFLNFRANDEVNYYNNQSFKSLRDSSIGSDDEWIIKNNIYRVFEQ